MDKNVLIAQIEIKTCDIKGNTNKIIDVINNNKTSDFIIFPEMTISGYNCGDLFEQDTFISECQNALNEIIKNVGDVVVIVGFPRKDGKYLKNSAAIIYNNEIVDFYDKILLANDYHHEDRKYFKPGKEIRNFYIKNTSFTVLICEDIGIQIILEI
jgi:NAD+ synthase (glutamine-hydrolysing)